LWKYRSELEDNLLTLEGHQDHITSFMVASKKHIFTGGKDCVIRKWFPKESLTPLMTMNGHS
jgi:WD40 repeat protein